jgi:hypothetical protein
MSWRGDAAQSRDRRPCFGLAVLTLLVIIAVPPAAAAEGEEGEKGLHTAAVEPPPPAADVCADPRASTAARHIPCRGPNDHPSPL